LDRPSGACDCPCATEPAYDGDEADHERGNLFGGSPGSAVVDIDPDGLSYRLPCFGDPLLRVRVEGKIYARSAEPNNGFDGAGDGSDYATPDVRKRAEEAAFVVFFGCAIGDQPLKLSRDASRGPRNSQPLKLSREALPRDGRGQPLKLSREACAFRDQALKLFRDSHD
jgi:hypothetical protein